jgi:hypothetical protein
MPNVAGANARSEWMKCFGRVLALGAVVIAAGCATKTPLMVPFRPDPVISRNYELGQVQSATVGEPIITIGSGRRVPVYTALYDYTPPNALPIRTGMKFHVVGTLGGDQWVVKNGSYNISHDLVVDRDGFLQGWHPRVGAPANIGDLQKPLFSRSEEILEDGKAFRAEIVYSGISGTTLNATYREYVNDLARPAFAQQLQYEVSQEREIAFRTIRLEVLRATNSQIEFKVVSDGGLPWIPTR